MKIDNERFTISIKNKIIHIWSVNKPFIKLATIMDNTIFPLMEIFYLPMKNIIVSCYQYEFTFWNGNNYSKLERIKICSKKNYYFIDEFTSRYYEFKGSTINFVLLSSENIIRRKGRQIVEICTKTRTVIRKIIIAEFEDCFCFSLGNHSLVCVTEKENYQLLLEDFSKITLNNISNFERDDGFFACHGGMYFVKYNEDSFDIFKINYN